MILDDYLIYLHEASKWKHLLKNLDISADTLKRIKTTKHGKDPLAKKAREKLIKAGKSKEAAKKYPKRHHRSGVKSHRQFTAGVSKGAENIIKKHGGKISRKLGSAADRVKGAKPQDTMHNPMLAFANTTPGKKPVVHVAAGVTKKQAGLRAQVKKHEADEIAAQARMRKVKGKRKMFAGGTEGSHASPEVLRREREISRMAVNLHGKKGHGDYLSNLRGSKGEYREIPEGGKKAIRKMEKKAAAARAKAIELVKKRTRANPKAGYKDIVKDKTVGDKSYRKFIGKQMSGISKVNTKAKKGKKVKRG